MSFKPEVQVIGDDKFYDNNLAFETYEEAMYSARDLMTRWALVRDYRAVPSTEPVNYKLNLATGVMEAVGAPVKEEA